MMPTENIGWESVLDPIAGTGFGTVFSVGRRSVVCRCYPASGETLEDDDQFELHAALEWAKATGIPSRTYAVKEKDPVSASSYGVLLGANMTQCEIVIRGDYVWKKLTATTPLVGVQASSGYEKTGS